MLTLLIGACLIILADIVYGAVKRRRTQREARESSVAQAGRVAQIMDTYRTTPRGALTQDEVNAMVAEFAHIEELPSRGPLYRDSTLGGWTAPKRREVGR